MKTLLKSEIDCLENYKFNCDEFSKTKQNRKENEYLLCIKNTNHTRQIDKIRRVDATAWEIVKSFFGFGKLANCDLRLSSIASHLEQHDLTSLVKDSKAYRAVHDIATRMLIYKKSGEVIPALWEKLATETKKITIERCEEHRFNCQPPTYQRNSSRDRFLLLTPLTKFGHLRAQVSILEGKNATHATVFNGTQTIFEEFGKSYCPAYRTINDTEVVDENSLKGVFFRIIELVSQTYRTYTYIHHHYTPN